VVTSLELEMLIHERLVQERKADGYMDTSFVDGWHHVGGHHVSNQSRPRMRSSREPSSADFKLFSDLKFMLIGIVSTWK